MGTTVDAVSVLRHDFPDLPLRRVTLLGSGWNNVAYLVDDETIFRLPSPRDAAQPDRRRAKVSAEIALLREVHGRLGVQTPLPTHIAPDGSYFGYANLPGDPMPDPPLAGPPPSDLPAATSSTADRPLGGPSAVDASDLQLAMADRVQLLRRNDFVRHWVDAAAGTARIVPVERALSIGLSVHDHVDAHLRFIADAGRLVPSGLADLVAWTYLEWAPRYRAALPKSIAMHADLGPSNWLVNSDGAITALIDWTDACIAPPERQLGYWPYEGSPELVDEAVASYADATGYQPDVELVYLCFLTNIFSDIGELVHEGRSIDNPSVTAGLDLATFWAQHLPRPR